MDISDLLNLFSMSGQKLDALWQFYVTVHIAIFGAIFVFHKMYKHQIIITIISYLAFSLINLRAKIYEYSFYNSILKDIKLNSVNLGENTTKFFSNYSLDDRGYITVTVHIVSFSFLVFIIWKEQKTVKTELKKA